MPVGGNESVRLACNYQNVSLVILYWVIHRLSVITPHLPAAILRGKVCACVHTTCVCVKASSLLIENPQVHNSSEEKEENKHIMGKVCQYLKVVGFVLR